jgi:hypothetical protein
MGVTAGPADWWVASSEALQSLITYCPEGTVLPDGSAIICKAGGTAWIVAPDSTQVSATWNGNTNVKDGDKCCVCDWSSLCTALVSAGFNPGDWFVPSCAQLQNPGYVCRTNWDSFSSPAQYWSSTEVSNTNAFPVCYSNNCGLSYSNTKTLNLCVRAMRCVNY